MVGQTKERLGSQTIEFEELDALDAGQIEYIRRTYGPFDLVTCYWGLGFILLTQVHVPPPYPTYGLRC